MCGFCGFNRNDPALLERMTDEMRHRGPDQYGFYTSDFFSLGHRRLSIIDLSENARQPMRNETGDVLLVVNGEIYNFQALRAELEGKGHVFRSRCDAEVIAHGYEEFGDRVMERLRGMFAFALLDLRKKRLLLARDRIGIKPLYYYQQNNRLVFASAIKAILKDPAVPRELNRQALYDYLGFELTPAPETMFRHIYKLPAGHYAIWENNALSVKQYWDLSFAPNPQRPSYHEAVERIRTLLDEAVATHLVSDVPLGVFLSGGLDSSSMVAMMRRHISGPLRTFTIGYADKSFSELDYASLVARRFDTEHHVLMADDVSLADIEKALWHLDEPMTDLSTIPLYLICRKARESAVVCISGEGGDESFAGYDRFKADKFDRLFKLLPEFVRRGLITKALERLPDRPQKKGFVNSAKRFVQGSNLPDAGRHLRWQYFLDRETEEKLFREEFKRGVTRDPFRLIEQYAARCDATDRINLEIYLDMRFMMTESVLMKVDKMSMANSLEVRVPFLDHVFVEYIASLPGRWKLNGYHTKAIFRSALKGILPETIVNRGKQGYSLPVKNLLRDTLKDYMKQLLNDSPVVKENMDPGHVNRLMAEHLAMTHNHNHILWALINVANWHNNVFSKKE